MHFDVFNTIIQILRVVFAILAILVFDQMFYIKDFAIKTLAYLVIYVVVSLILEAIISPIRKRRNAKKK